MMITISSSKREQAGCLYYFAKKNILRDPAPVNPNLNEGTFLHDVARDYARELYKKKETSDLELLDEAFSKLWKIQTILSQDYYHSLYQVARFWAERFELDVDTYFAAEFPIGFTVDLEYKEFPNLDDYEREDVWCQENGIWVHQRLDRVHIKGTKAKIHDYKTARGMRSESIWRTKAQPAQYAWALFNHPGCHYVEEVEVEFDYMRKGRKVSLRYKRPDVQDMVKELRTFHSKILGILSRSTNDAGELNEDWKFHWPAHQCDTCEICTYACPLNDDVEIPAVIQDADVAKRLAQKYLAIERESATIKDRLKVYTRERPPVVLETGSFQWVATDSFKAPKASALVEYCLQKGVDVNQVLSANTEKIKKIPDDEIRQEIVAMGKTATKDSFKYIEVEPKEEDEE